MKKSPPLDSAQTDDRPVDLSDEIEPENGSSSSILEGQRLDGGPDGESKNAWKQTANDNRTPARAAKNSVSTQKITELLGGEFDEQPDEDGDLDISNCQSNDKKVRIRSVMGETAVAILELHYQCNPKPNRDEINELSSKLKLPQRVLQVWYQNRRAKVGDLSL